MPSFRLNMDLLLILLFLLPWCLQAQRPSYFYGRQLTLSQTPCFDAKGEQGICMFRFDCIRENGVPMTTCKEKFLFGVCCQLQDETLLTSSSTPAPTSPFTMSTVSDEESMEDGFVTEPVGSWTLDSNPTQTTSDQNSQNDFSHLSGYHTETHSTNYQTGTHSAGYQTETHSTSSHRPGGSTNFPVLVSDQHSHGAYDTGVGSAEPIVNYGFQVTRPVGIDNGGTKPKPDSEITIQYGDFSSQTAGSTASFNQKPLEQTLSSIQYQITSSQNYSDNPRPSTHFSDSVVTNGVGTVEHVEGSQANPAHDNSMIALTHFLLQNASLDNLNELDTTDQWTLPGDAEEDVSFTTPAPADLDTKPVDASQSPLDTLIALLHPGNSLNVTSTENIDDGNTGTWQDVSLESSVTPPSYSVLQASTTATSKLTTAESTTSQPSTTSARPVWDYRKTCGVRPLRPTGRVVGGRNAYFGEWPWQVLVKEATWLGLFVKNKCGGVLINNKFVLTAAHCQPGFLASLLVLLGEYDLTGDFENLKPVTKNVKRMIVHRDYNPQTFEHDIALLELDSPVQVQPHIVPICLPKLGEDFAGKRAYVSGWGKLTHGGSLPSVLQAVRVPIARNSECQQMFLSAGHIKAIRDTFICAGFTQGGRDSCEGDSGGPLMIQRRDLRWVLVGTVSHGIGCADPNLPGVYMRTTSYLKWISSIIGPVS